MKRIRISISALSSEPTESHKKRAEKLLEKVFYSIRKQGCNPLFYLGGYAGLMRHAIDFLSMLSSNTIIVTILPIEYEKQELPPNIIPVYTGMSYQNRNPILVRSGDFILSLGGGAGSIMEIYNSVALGKNVLQLVNTGMPSDYLFYYFKDGVIDPNRNGRVTFVDIDSEEAHSKINEFVGNECEKIAMRVK